MFLDGHNKMRNQHALGKTEGIFNETTVADMATIVSKIVFPLKKKPRKLSSIQFAGLG